jgi:uncharacterized protein (UPF0264 family)
MTVWRGLLISVREPSEVAAALAGGATIIDVKDPAAGSLGAAAPATAGAVARAVAGRVPWTIAAGEVAAATADEIRRWLDAVAVAAGGPPAAVKFGLAGMAGGAWREAWAAALAAVPRESVRVAAAYADWRRAGAPHPLDVVAAGADLGCGVWLVDTADKSAAGLLDVCATDELVSWIEAARAAGMRVAVAGKIGLGQIPQVRRAGADVVALRSAVCSNGRSGAVDSALVRAAAAMLVPPGESSS